MTDVDVSGPVTAALERSPAVRGVRLVGSRAQGTAVEMSDWDFLVDVEDFDAVAAELPRLVAPLEPLAQQWDRLSEPTRSYYMLMLRGPTKVDLVFDRPHEPGPPWEVTAATLPAIDLHFWDWVYWIACKHSAGWHELVAAEFRKLSTYLLEPMGVEHVPDAVAEAIADYTAARARHEQRLAIAIPPEPGNEVLNGLRRFGYVA